VLAYDLLAQLSPPFHSARMWIPEEELGAARELLAALDAGELALAPEDSDGGPGPGDPESATETLRAGRRLGGIAALVAFLIASALAAPTGGTLLALALLLAFLFLLFARR
jgi:hypothetical protein